MSIKSSEVVLLVALPNVIPGREAVLKQQSGTSFSTRASSAALLATAASPFPLKRGIELPGHATV